MLSTDEQNAAWERAVRARKTPVLVYIDPATQRVAVANISGESVLLPPPVVHDEPLIDDAGNLVLANGNMITITGVPD